MIKYVKPNWNIEEVKKLNFNLSPFKNDKLVLQYAQSGHDKTKISLFNYHEPNEMPKFITDYVKPHFDFLDKVCPVILLILRSIPAMLDCWLVCS